MTFDEWFTAHYVECRFVSIKDELREAWEAATNGRDEVWKTEIDSHISAITANVREACAKICDELAATTHCGPAECADAIRSAD